MNEQRHETVECYGKPVLSYELSLAVAFATGAIPKYCYANVWHAIRELPLLSDARLVEGWMVLEQASQVALIEHCWSAYEDHSIIDPSMVLLIGRGHPVYYFPGMVLHRAEVEALACHNLPYVRSAGIYGPDGMRHPDYQAAYRAARAHARSLALTSQPAKAVVVQPSHLPTEDAECPRLAVQIVSSEAFLKGRNAPSGRSTSSAGGRA